MWIKVINLLVILLVAVRISGAEGELVKPQLAGEDEGYLRQLAQDTWNCMDYFRAPETGFPYDSNHRPETTNTTNLGLYLISLPAAEKFGFITRAEAVARAGKILESLKRIEAWHGFYNNGLDVHGKTKAKPGMNAVSDFNKLPAALLLLRQAYPEVKLADELFKQVDWGQLWQAGKPYQGFDIITGEMADWGKGWFAADTRMAFFLAVASGGMPLQGYAEMERFQVEQYGLSFYRPAWEFAGLFMHAICGLLLDERDTKMGLSAANFALAQMIYAREKQYPAWGWSACNLPNDTEDYTIDGHLSQAVITPHASALALDFYPRKVVENLRTLEKLGCRPAYVENGKAYAFGFRDAINLVTGEVSELYYTGLDQAMLFLAISNHLEVGYIWKLYAQDPVVKKGLQLIEPVTPKDPSLLALYAKRDQAELPEATLPIRKTGAPKIIDRGEQTGKNLCALVPAMEVENMPVNQAVYATKPGSGIVITYDERGFSQARARLVEPLGGLDAREWNAVAFRCRAQNPEKLPLSFRIRITDNYKSNVTGFIEGVAGDWEEVVFPFESFKGMLVGCDALQTLEFSLEQAPLFMPDKRLNVLQGTLELAEIRLVALDSEAKKKAVWAMKTRNKIRLSGPGEPDGIMRLQGWRTYSDQSAAFSLKINTQPDPSMQISYQLGPQGRWVAWEKNCEADLTRNFLFSFEYQAAGDGNCLELKWMATAGGVFGKKIEFQATQGEWRKIALKRADMQRLWGGKESDSLGRIKQLGMAISGNSGTKGEMHIRKIIFEQLAETK